MFKEACAILSPALSEVFNFAVKNGAFPETGKLASVTPIHKKDSTQNPANYRLISLISCLSTLFERAVYRYFFDFLKNDITDLQHGFLRNKSTISQLHDI